MRGKIGRRSLVWLGLVWLAASQTSAADWNNRCLTQPAAAARSLDGPDKPWISWQLREENDFLAFPGSDELYTQGALITLHRDPREIPPWAGDVGRWLGERFSRGRETCLIYGVEFGQHIFSPEDLARTELIVDDRPYVGYLYGGVVFTLTERDRHPIQHIFELQAGFVGPESGAESIQARIHEINGSQKPLGWNNQLPFEPGLNLIYLWRRKWGNSTADIVPHWGAAFGSFQIAANAGATLRWGKNMSDFPVRINQPTLRAKAEGDERPKWEAYLFAGADGRLVGHNIFLDGTVFSDSHSVDKESFVYDLKAGFSVRRKNLRRGYTFVRRRREFEPLAAGRTEGDHDFGSVSFTVVRAF